MISIKNVLVPTDFGEPAVAALTYGRTLAARFSATLHVVNVVEDLALKTITAEGFVSFMPDLQREIEEAARKRLDALLTGQGPDPAGIVSAVVTSNATADAIATYAKNAGVDVIVIGTHGRSGVSRLLLGSVAERVVRTAPCPVLTVHADAVKTEAAA
jgi:nucleotide-binding universal stress UspA family protein